MTFKDLHLVPPILEALDKAGYTNPTPIQEQAIPFLLRGKDLLGCAQTGTGKTAAFAIPILQNIFLDTERNIRNRKIKALIVTPTRELAIQIDDNFSAYSQFTNIRNTVIFGGVKQGKQVDQLRRGVDVLVATPGRLLDLISQGYVSLRDIDYFVLDEADQMLDMGFIHDIRKLLTKLPSKRQSLFFSATMPSSIVSLSKSILGDFETVTIKPEKPTAERVEQQIYYVNQRNKIKLLVHIINTHDPETVLVFSRTKHGADKVVRLLKRDNIPSEAIHGNKSQNARQRALSNFKNGRTRVLVATDIAARGIDVSKLELVINYDLPNVPETYVHRIGRTGRASASGIAMSFCNSEELAYVRDIQRLIKQKIDVVNEHPYVDDGSDYLNLGTSLEDSHRTRRPNNHRGGGGGRNSRNRNSTSRGRSNNNRRR